MTMNRRLAAPLLATLAVAGAIGLAAPAAARPDCVNTAPNTTMCTTNGSSSLTTSPPANNNGPWGFGGYPFGGFAFGIF